MARALLDLVAPLALYDCQFTRVELTPPDDELATAVDARAGARRERVAKRFNRRQRRAYTALRRAGVDEERAFAQAARRGRR